MYDELSEDFKENIEKSIYTKYGGFLLAQNSSLNTPVHVKCRVYLIKAIINSVNSTKSLLYNSSCDSYVSIELNKKVFSDYKSIRPNIYVLYN